jgi:lipid II:glycine glycyltransferase (peptidoglycan interpeptide bridge formation enzyme)
MKPLHPEYVVEVDRVDRNSWDGLIRSFRDNNIYQTWAYETARRNKSSHLVLKRNGRIVAAAQARLLELPLVGWGVAYIRWGPLWKGSNGSEEIEILRQALRAVRSEYAERRGLLVRVYPVLFEDEADLCLPVFGDEGYSLREDLAADRTLILDLTPSLEEIRKRFDRKWRNHLNRAERNDLEILQGSGDDLFNTFVDLYNEMLERKQFVDTVDLREFRAVQSDLPESFKMRTFIARAAGQPGAGVVCSALGDTGIYLFGATNGVGMRTKGAYLLQWAAITWLKGLGITQYNLHGINPEKNPGVYEFKIGLCGKSGKDVHFLGRFETSANPISRMVVRFGESIRNARARLIAGGAA